MDIQTLQARWVALLQPYAKQPALEQGFEQLVTRYNEPPRYYHTLGHIESCLGFLDQVAAKISDPFSIEVAIWFHDVIYDPLRADNEAASAEYAQSFLAEIGIAPPQITKIVQLIHLTKHPATPETDDEKYLLDIDLAILGAEPELYEQYTQQIRQEYSFVPIDNYRAGRAALLQKFLEKERIFATDYFYDRCEERARANLSTEIEQLSTIVTV